MEIKKKNQYIVGLDGLRALAVIMVLGYHLKIPAFKGGVLGVTVFFVLSGFLITRLLLQELDETKTVNIKNFWVRRIRRIWPALLLMASIVIIVSAIFNRVIFTKASKDFISVILGYNNWYQIFNNISYFDNGGAPSPLLHCWSVAIETQFYLVFPLLLIGLSKIKVNIKKKRNIIMGVITALIVMSSLWMLILFNPDGDPTRVYYGLDTRAFSLLVGSLLATFVYYYRNIKLNKVVNNVVGIVSLIGICFIVYNVAGYDALLYRGGYLVASILTAFVILSILKKGSLLAKGLALKPIDWIGKLSYSIYLWHYPIIILISGGKKSSLMIMIIEVVLTLIMATLSYYLVETPIRHRALSKIYHSLKDHTIHRKLSLRRQLTMVLLVCVLFITSSLCVAFVPKESVMGNAAEVSAQSTKEKEKSETKEPTPSDNLNKDLQGLEGDELAQKLRVLLIGDSVSLGARDTLPQLFPNINVNAKVSRQCSVSLDIINAEKNAGWKYDCLVFSLGSNGPMYDYMQQVRDLLPKNNPLFILSLKAPYDEYTDENNGKIKDYCKNTKNVYLVDWEKYSQGHDDWFYNDETHLNEKGKTAFSQCIKDYILEAYKTKTKGKSN